jgi:hypothetical protein
MASLAGTTNAVLANTGNQTACPSEDKTKTIGGSKIEKLIQVPEFAELMDALLNKTERAGFEPAVETSPTQPFQGCSISRSDTSP